ncbi:ervatamin-B-like [Neltuma alba]|uniref:ervatamin-B-like n=1 Tax=Neltuma alba TaxID=207710 RepID=UPI0010A50EF7|nr:ervatamin-B-like [Prosopis alba]
MAFYISKTSFLHFLILNLILTCLSSGFIPSEGEEEYETFQQWMKQHARMYPNSEESESRYQIFRMNLKHIKETNAKRSNSSGGGYRLGLNKFADMSPEEFKRVYLRQLPAPTTTNPATTASRSGYVKQDSCTPPASVDWRQKGAVTPVKDQQRCGSCWAFGSIGAIESIHAIQTGELVSLSEQELVDCDSVSHGCSGGSPKSAFEWVIRNGGISKEEEYPYVARDDSCKANTQNEDSGVKITNYAQVDQSEEALLCAVAQQPITVSLDASNLQFYDNGIYAGQYCSRDSNYVNHAVLIVGYGSKDGNDYWIVKNSWGENWGINGYFHVKRNTDFPNGVCAINTMAFYPTI